MMHTRLLRAFVAAFLLMMGMLTLNVAQPVSAASATTTNTVTLEGQSSEQTKLSKQAMCDECMPDDLFICGDGCEVAGGGKISVHTSVSWSAPLQVDTTADAAELSQGNSTDVISTLTPGAGEITINYRIPYQIGLFARNGDFPDGPDWHPTTEYTLVDEFNISTSAPCTPSLAGDGTGTCNVTDSINLLPETCFFALCPVDITVNLLVTHQFDIVGTEIVAHRVTTNAAPADIHYDGASPASETEEIDVPCDANVGDDINYDLSGFNYEPDVSVTGDLGIEFVIDGPLFLDASPVLDLVEDFPVFDGTVPMSDDTAHAFLGDTLLDNQPPQISAVLQSGTFVEGSDVTFNAVATDNCADGLNYLWSWSDHGTAFGSPAHHSFDDDGNGYTGRVVVVDAAGNQDIDDYLVEPIANVKPNATAPPDAAADWGIPVQFHASAVDPGPADQPTLAFAWNFGDGQGAAGPDVSHTFAAPDDYDVEVTVTDKDGGVGTAAMTTSISKRDTDLVYTGPTQSLPNKQINLSATLSDEHGRPVVGRSVSFALGTQSASGVTNSAGVVSVSLRLTQKNGTYQVSTSFAGDTLYNSDSTTPIDFRIGK